MVSQRAPLGKVVGAMDPKWFGDPVGELGLFEACTTVNDIRVIFREQVEIEVGRMLDLISDADAFDVIELMRMREFSPVADPRAVVSDGSGLAVEIVAAVLLSRPNRKPDPRPRRDTRPHEKISELHQLPDV